MRVVVVGGGIAGLSASIQLAVDGAEVILIESRDTLGGRVRIRNTGGWIIDPGLHLMREKGPLHQLLRKLRAPRAIGKKFSKIDFLSIPSDSNDGLSKLENMNISSTSNVSSEFIIPRGGWSSIIGRLIVAVNQLNVEVHTGKKVESIILKGEKIQSIVVNGKKIHCNKIVLAIPPTETAFLLKNAGLNTSELDSCEPQLSAAMDIAIEAKVMSPNSGLFDLNSGVIAIDLAQKDRIPFGREPNECSIIHAVNLRGDGDSALEEIKQLLDLRCAGWRKHVSKRRSTPSIMIHPCTLEQRIKSSLYSSSGIILAGAHVISDYILSDASVSTGRNTSKLIHH